MTNTAAQNKAALLAAIQQADGAPVHIASGLYPLAPLTITTPNTTLLFAPGATLCVPEGSKLPALLDIRADFVTVDGGTFDGGGVVGAHGIMAIRLIGSPHHITIRNCTVRNAGCAIGSYNVRHGSDWLIEGNTIEGTVQSHAIYLHGDPQEGTVSNVRVVGNTIEGAKANGIWVGNGFSDVRVSGNRVTGSGRMGIEVWGNAGGFVVSDNLIDGCGSFGLSIAGTPLTICANNIVKGARNFGIEIAACRGVALTGNIVEGVADGRIKATGISINANSHDSVGDIVITGGIISGCVAAINLCGGNYRRDSIVVSGVLMRDCVYGVRNVGYVGQKDGGGSVRHATITGNTIVCKTQGIGHSLYGGVMHDSVIEGNNVVVEKK